MYITGCHDERQPKEYYKFASDIFTHQRKHQIFTDILCIYRQFCTFICIFIRRHVWRRKDRKDIN